MSVESPEAWKTTACILCECNCGINVQLGGDDGRKLVRFHGDPKHPSSRGYVCEKPQRLDHYQNGPDRITTPLRRRDDGTFEAISWEVAIEEVAARLARLRDAHGGASILYYGGGGQGNHLPGAYATSTRRALKARYRSNALAQEKTGEFWVSERMLGAHTRADFEHCDVGVFIGKNPWYSHGIPRARATLRELSRDPARTLIVVDPRKTKTAALADIHLQLKPGTDAWLLAALIKLILDDDHVDHAFVEAHTEGIDAIRAAFAGVDVAAYAAHAGLEEALVREAAARIGGAERLSTFEDLGVQMSRHSTVVSYLHRLIWLLTGNLGRPGTHYVPTTLVDVADGRLKHRTPVTSAPLIGGLVPCNAIADEILNDHPDRFRAAIVEAANPIHSLAGSARLREAFAALDTVVVIDVAMTETAKSAHYVLPASTQYEKAEATFFNFDFPHNCFQLRPAILAPPSGPLPEAEIHARLTEALGGLDGMPLDTLRAAASQGLDAYTAAFAMEVAMRPDRLPYASALLYRTLAPALPPEQAEGAVLLGLALKAAMSAPASLARAGFKGAPMQAAAALFQAMLDQPSGVVFADDRWEDVIRRTRASRGGIQLALDDLLAEVKTLTTGPGERDPAFPLVLSAGERRAFTANTIFRGPGWRRKDAEGALRISPDDADALGLASGDLAVLTTHQGSARVRVSVTDTMQPGHISLPNGMGLDGSSPDLGGVPLNELTRDSHRDPFAGTPLHKHVPARVEAA